MNKSVLCFGEALIDFLNTGSQQDDNLMLRQFTQFPGGAPANAAVAVAKLGGRAKFAGQVGQDKFGDFLKCSLDHYGVDTQLMYMHPKAKTALAFVFLDGEGERSFSFHRENTADMLFEPSQVNSNWFAEPSIFHFCSNTLTEPPIAEVTQYILSHAKERQSIISFDVNLRHNLWPTGEADRALVNQMVFQSQLVKFAKEELDFLNEGKPDAYFSRCFTEGVETIVVTDGAHPIQIITASQRVTISPPKVKVADTTGGGDAFIGAVLYCLSQQQAPDLSDIQYLSSLVRFASQCGAFAVSRFGAFPAFPRFDEVKEYYHEL